MAPASRPGERTLTALIIVVVVAAPLLVGGALAWTQVALSALCLACIVGCFAQLWGAREMKLSPLSGALLAAAAATALQLVPLPRFLVGWLSPEAVAARMDATGAAPALLPLTLDVPATLLALVQALATAGLFITVASLAHRRRRSMPILAAIAAAAAVVAAIGIVQRGIGADHILGLYKPDWTTTFVGTFVNSNHAAEFLGLGLCLCIGLAAEVSVWRPVAVGGAIVCMAGLGLCTSRGGLVAFGLASLVLLGLILARSFGRIAGPVLGLVAVALVVAAAVMFNEPFSRRFAQVDLGYLFHNQKVDGWRDALAMVRDFAWTGVGRGAFMAPFQRYRVHEEGVSLTHPENIVVQLLSEWGVPLTLLVVGLGAVALWKHRRRATNLGPAEWGAACGVLGVLLQNLVDFGLEMSGIALPVAAALGVVVARACAKERVERYRVGRRGMVAITAAWSLALVLGLWSLPHTLRADDRRLTRLLEDNATVAAVDDEAARAIARHPCDYHLELLDAIAHVRAGDGQSLHHINRVLRLRPQDVDAHRLAGLALARTGRARQAALEYRTAFAHGLPLKHSMLDELTHSGVDPVEAVPQTAEALMTLAVEAAPHQPALADRALLRALEAVPTDERSVRMLLRLATEAHDVARLGRAAHSLEERGPSPEAQLAAARGYHDANLHSDERRVLFAARTRWPQEAVVTLAWAQLCIESGDLPGARSTLVHLTQSTTDLDARHRAEELRAVLEDIAGDNAAAVSARTRARLYGKALSASDSATDGDLDHR